MRVFVAGASGAIGTRLVPRLIEAGHEVIGTSRSAGNADRVRALGAHPIALDLLDARSRHRGRRRRGARRDRPSGDRPCGCEVLQEPGPHLRADQPAAHRGHRRAAGRRPRGRRAPLRRPELRQLPLRARGRADQDRGRSARPRPGCDDARDERRDAPSRRGGHRRRRDRPALWRLLRRAQRRAARARAQAPVPDRRRRRRHLLVHPPRRRRRGHRARARARRCGRLQHRRRRARPGARVAAGAGRPCSAPSRPATSRAGWHGCSRAKPPS